jgi:UDP-glucose 4-epimerase
VNILVLGGDGFLGSHFVDQAVRLGHIVSVFDRFPYGASKNLEHERPNVRCFSGEFADQDVLSRALVGQDIVYHFIWATNPATSWSDPLIEVDSNLRNTIQLCELAASKGVLKLVFPSSGGTVYGHSENLIKEDQPANPSNPYGIAKLAAEFFIEYFQKRFGLNFDVYRIGNAYGPRQPGQAAQGVVAAWMHAILSKTPVYVYGDELVVRDYVYVRDASYLMTHSLRELRSSGIYNIGSGVGTSTAELLTLFQEVIDEPFEFIRCSKRPFDNSRVVLDSSKILAFFPGFKFQVLREKILELWLLLREEFRDSSVGSLDFLEI